MDLPPSPLSCDSALLLLELIHQRGVETRVSPGGELMIRDRGKRLSAEDRELIHQHRHRLADCVRQPRGSTSTEVARSRDPRESVDAAAADAPTCTRCGSQAFVETPIHGGRSVRRDCARCRRTWGFPVWRGET